MPTLPELTHAEVMRRIQSEVDQCGSLALAARVWNVTPQLLGYVLAGKRSVGPKLQKALKLRRVRLVVHRYANV